MSDPNVIYLGPECEDEFCDGRTWADHVAWPDCDCKHKPVRYNIGSDYDAALAREAALREELDGYEPASSGTASKRARWLLNIQDAIKYGLPKHLVGRLNNTAKEIQNSIKYGGTKRLRDENEALQQRLTDAEKLLLKVVESGALIMEQETTYEQQVLEADICAALKPVAGSES